MAKRKPTLGKGAVHYRHGTAEEHCGNCVMFHYFPDNSNRGHGRCDLVVGLIAVHMVCDRWEKRPE